MPSLSSWYLKIAGIGGAKYKTGANDCQINYRGNNFQEATLTFPDSTGLYTNAFTNEQEVQVYIGDPDAGGILMLHGFVDEIDTSRQPSREENVIVHVIDWASYLASKTPFEVKYFREKTPQQIYQQSGQAITDGVDTLSIAGVQSIPHTDPFVGEFQGTYVKDIWSTLAEQFNAEYFADENLVLQAFASGARFLEHSINNTFRIRDIAPTLARDLTILHRKPYNLKLDNTERVRTVVATNLIAEGFPTDLKAFEEKQYFQGKNYGKKYSQLYIMGAEADYNVDTIGNTFEPVVFNAAEEIGDPLTEGTIQIPTVRLNVARTAQSIGITIRPHDESVVEPFKIKVNEWQEISFYMYNGLSLTVTSLKLQLFDSKSGVHYWERQINPYLPPNTWVFFRFKLPTPTSNVESYTGVPWTKTGTPEKIDFMFFEITPNTGHAANSFVKFGQMFFYRTKRAVATVAGNPPTQKLIVKKDLKTVEALQQFADAELLRINKNVVSGLCTIDGNTNFKRPGYLVDVDFTTTLGTGRSALGANGARLELIRHYLEDSYYYTDLTFNNAFDRQ